MDPEYNPHLSTAGLRAFCQSLEDTFHPRQKIPYGDAPRLLPETFLAGALAYLLACCDQIDALDPKHH